MRLAARRLAAMSLTTITVLSGYLARAADAPLFVLREQGGALRVERMTVIDGQTLTLDAGPESDVIDVILPVGPGGSGNMADRRTGRTFTVKNTAGTLTVAERMPDGRGFERPARPLDELRTCDTRVSVVGANGQGEAFVVRGYETVSRDPAGPVVDMFAGKVPLSPRNYLISTDTWPVSAGSPLNGTVELEFNRYLFVRGRAGNGREGDFVIDLGAGSTILAKNFLPPSAKITPAATVQYSSAGKELLKYEPEGATGKVQSVLGHCELETFTLGGLDLGASSADVMEALPKLAGREIAGIIGLDVLRRAEVVRLEFKENHARLILSGAAGRQPGSGKATGEQPFAIVNSHVLTRTGEGDRAVYWVLDSGSPDSILDKQAADALHIAPQAGGAAASGLDGAKIAFTPATLPELVLCGKRFSDLKILFAALPIFDRLHTHDQRVGLLGNDVFSRCGFVELDFSQRTMRIGAN